MARKYDLISELYNRTCKTVVSNPQNWQAFLASACRNYKLRYDEQLLVYAQRPDATAVLEIEQWNKIFGRWVNRGARGIAVFADENRSRQRLTHYFDISDTHESRYSRTVPIWDMRQEYEADVIETLESTFGEIENKSSLAEAIMGAARNAAEDNIPDYLQDLYYATEGSSFEEVEEDIVAFIYKNVVTNSVAYMMMSRLGVDTDGYFELDDFRDVTNFNTQETLNALGFATSDIAEMGLTEISKTITALNRQNRIIVGQDRNEYNKVENNDERSLDDERTDLHDGGRLQPSEPETSTAAGSDVGQIRSDEERVSEGTSQSPLLQSPDEGRTDTALGGSGTESQQDGGNNPEPDGTERGSDRTDESGGYNEMGSSDELSSQFGTGNRESGSDIRLEYYDRTHEDKSLPFFGRDEVINEILRTTPHLSASLEEIKDYYERNPDNKDRTEYVKSIFNNDYTELTLEDGRTVGYKTFENVLHLWEGKYDSRTAQSYYDWAVIARHFEAMRLLGELSDSIKPLPSMDGQMTFILDGWSTPYTTNAKGQGPAWANSLFEDNAEFGYGMLLAQRAIRDGLKAKVEAVVAEGKDEAVKEAGQEWLDTFSVGATNGAATDKLIAALEACGCDAAKEILAQKNYLSKKSQWIFGGDGWAYDIGFGGVDHVLASGRDINVMVFDTEVYSNTGGQSSKATKTGATAQFAAGGKETKKKDLAGMAMTYGYVYVAQIAMGADFNQTVKAIAEAEAYPGPSLIIAYAPCINHGIKKGMSKAQTEEQLAVECGYWNNFRYNPAAEGDKFSLDSKAPKAEGYQDFLNGEVRYNALKRANPAKADKLFALNEQEAMERYDYLNKLVTVYAAEKEDK